MGLLALEVLDRAPGIGREAAVVALHRHDLVERWLDRSAGGISKAETEAPAEHGRADQAQQLAGELEARLAKRLVPREKLELSFVRIDEPFRLGTGIDVVGRAAAEERWIFFAPGNGERRAEQQDEKPTL